jgi:tRNA-specific 2-thiouridylase
VKVLVAMSGGVDSSVAAALLRDEGHDVTGVTLKLWGGPSDTGCCSVSDVDDARRVAHQLGIPHFVFNLGDEFARHVVEPYVADHRAGRTPNPCIECNRHIKFDTLLRRAGQLDFDAVATGHHARVGTGPALARGADRAKDQSYVLYMLDRRQLARCRFPIGDLTKAEVRGVAACLGLRTAAKADSQDVCFITAQGRQAFLAERAPLTRGRLVDRTGAEVGHTAAVELVTVGQRRGLDLGGSADRRYALAVDAAAATVTVGTAEDLLCDHQDLRDHSWPVGSAVLGEVLVQTSAHGRPQPARLTSGGRVEWREPQRRMAPGQAAVFYDLTDEVVLGGAVAV